MDVCGPSIPLLMGVTAGQVVSTSYGWTPVKCVHRHSPPCPFVQPSLAHEVERHASHSPHPIQGRKRRGGHVGGVPPQSPRQSGHLRRAQEDECKLFLRPWTAPCSCALTVNDLAAMIKRFLKDVLWGRLDALIIDTPPGTSDEHLSVLAALQVCRDLS